MARQFLDDTAITVARVKIHVRVNPRWVIAQNLFHAAGLLKEVFPICGGEQAQAEKQLATIASFANAGEANWFGISRRLFGVSIPVSSAAA